MNRKLFLGLFLIFVLVFGVVGLVSCVIPAKVLSGSSTPALVKAVHPSSTTAISLAGEAFLSDYTCDLDSITLGLAKVGFPTGHLVVKLFAVQSGSVGSSAVPTSTALDTSLTNLDSASLGVDIADKTFVFDGDYSLNAGQSYCWAIEAVDAVFDVDNYVKVNDFMNNPNSTMNSFSYYSSGFHYWANEDYYFYINTDVEPSPSPSPSPVPSVSVPSPVDPFVSVPAYYMVLLVLFAVVAVLAGIYMMFEREKGNKGVVLLFGLVALVIFVVLLVGYLVG